MSDIDNLPAAGDETDLDALLDGVLASSLGTESDSWIELVTAPAETAGRDALMRRLAERAASRTTGLGLSPAPRERLDALRDELSRRQIDGFLVPLADAHQGEFVAEHTMRLAWLTGFTGSAGLAVVLADKAAVFVDGRYTLQVRHQVDTSAFDPVHLSDTTPDKWLRENLSDGQKVGFDPWLHTSNGIAKLRQAAATAGGELIPLDDNPVDAVWADRPPAPISPAVVHSTEFAGLSSAEKRAQIADALGKDGTDAAILTAPDSIAWLLNMRGRDISNTPVTLAFAIIHATGDVDLFVDDRKLTTPLRDSWDDGVAVSPPEALPGALARFSGENKSVRIDPATAPVLLTDILREGGAKLQSAADPCQIAKARKNPVERDGTRAAHIRDGAALTRFLAWLAEAGPAGGVTELSAAARLLAFRREVDLFQGVSFETISGAGPNGAIVHYRVTPETDRVLDPGSVYLVDSGGQYLDGTTDVTRTVWIAGDAPPSEELRDRFTRVLKGHIALARARFPVGTAGGQLDSFARHALWDAGLDYDHGTGHGVGSYLGVHEGPQRIGKQGSAVALEPGMIVSNEPGYYKEGAYGIRIENLVLVTEPEKPDDGERELLRFETLTLAPIDRALIAPDLLTGEERVWLNAYHARVREVVGPLVDDATASWLAEVTGEI